LTIALGPMGKKGSRGGRKRDLEERTWEEEKVVKEKKGGWRERKK